MTEAAQSASVFVRHLARDPQTRVQRRLRSTNQLDFMLASGRRIRRKNVRTTELGKKEVREDLPRIQEAIDRCVLEVLDDTGSPMTSDDLANWVGAPVVEKTQVNSSPAKPEPPATTEVSPTTQPEPPAKSEVLQEVEAEEDAKALAAVKAAEEAKPSEVDTLGATTIPGGKYQGKTLAWLVTEDPEYFENIPRNLAKHQEVVVAAMRYAELIGEE